jgi:ASC-1-like (ASCH) protein
LPLLYTRKEVFEWLKQGKKTIDVRKGKPQNGEVAVFQSGPHVLRFRIVNKESGALLEVLRLNNFRLVIPSAVGFEDAVGYLR